MGHIIKEYLHDSFIRTRKAQFLSKISSVFSFKTIRDCQVLALKEMVSFQVVNLKCEEQRGKKKVLDR